MIMILQGDKNVPPTTVTNLIIKYLPKDCICALAE